MSIKVTHTMRTPKTDTTVYVGRPSVLGNPFTVYDTNVEGHTKVNSIEEAVTLYEDYFYDKVDEATDVEFMSALEDIFELVQLNDEVHLSCWCKDEVKPYKTDYSICHADVIRNFIEQELESE